MTTEQNIMAGTQEEISLAFEYMVLELSKKFVEIKYGNVSNWTKIFNDDNDFTKEKCELFPYLITISNGKKKELLSFFNNEFIPSSKKGGVIHPIIESLLTADTFKFLNFKADKLELASNIELDIKTFITRNIGNPSNLTIILNFIETSIIFLHEKRLRNFATLDFETISLWSRNGSIFEAFSIVQNLEPNQIKEYNELIEFENTELSPSR